ncbi:MAG: XkdX family protein [Lacticaseibacillus paracasei]|nr:XkdX family protein [Lacticaseibacillus paracasei]
MQDFIKMMYQLGCPIEDYVSTGAITPDEYKQITGSDYVASKS